MNSYKIAVAVPTYKRKALLMRLIESTPKEWNLYISDNESSLLPLEGELLPNVVVSHSPILVPMFANWNRALSLVGAEATHILIPSDDDLFLPQAGEVVRSTLQKHSDADIIVFGCDLFDEGEHRWKGYCPQRHETFRPGEGFLKFIYGVDARMPGILFRRSFLDEISAFDERLELTAADSDLVQRALLLGNSVFVPRVIGLYRVWRGGLTHTRLATDQWIGEIELWTDKIATLMRELRLDRSLGIDLVRFRDEILARNLYAGLRSLMARKEYDNARAFSEKHPTPPKALLRTRMRLFACNWLIRSGIHW